MSLDRTIHLGPLIRIPAQYEESESKIRTCGEHVNHKGDAFCPTCGNKILEQSVKSKSMLWPDELIGNENLIHYKENDVMYLFSNTKSKTDIDTDENVCTVLTQELIESMINEFKEKHAKDIEALEAKINQKVKVEFGFVYEVS